MKQIPLTCGLFALVDDSNFQELSKHKWRTLKTRDLFYAVRSSPRPNRKTLLMHKEVFPGHLHIDHKNGNGLDNQRENLRPATTSQNGMNREKQKNNTSGFKGVYWFKRDKKWTAKIQVDSRQKYLGAFNNVRDAARAYDCAAKIYFGEFASLNKI